jgi:hypothetical protein
MYVDVEFQHLYGVIPPQTGPIYKRNSDESQTFLEVWQVAQLVTYPCTTMLNISDPITTLWEYLPCHNIVQPGGKGKFSSHQPTISGAAVFKQPPVQTLT